MSEPWRRAASIASIVCGELTCATTTRAPVTRASSPIVCAAEVSANQGRAASQAAASARPEAWMRRGLEVDDLGVLAVHGRRQAERRGAAQRVQRLAVVDARVHAGRGRPRR